MQGSCAHCSTPFERTSNRQLYCSKKCGQRVRYMRSDRGTEYQYSLQSGDWRKYYTRRIGEKGRRATLSVDDLLEIHARQDGKCAISGVPLTCVLKKGTPVPTNASIDRIEAGGPYVKGNVQLVCAALNRLRLDMPTEVFVGWCHTVSDHWRSK